jgi:hypothetical protein
MKKGALSLFSTIQNMDDALKMTRNAAYSFYLVAALQCAIGVLVAPALVIDAVIYLILAFFIHRFKSRIASLSLLLLVGLVLITTFQNRIGGGGEGGNNLLLSLIMVGVAIRAVEATFKYQNYRKAGV